MADDATCGEVDNLFGDIGAVVGHEFALVSEFVKMEGKVGGHEACGDFVFGVAEKRVFECGDSVLRLKDNFGEIWIAA